MFEFLDSYQLDEHGNKIPLDDHTKMMGMLLWSAFGSPDEEEEDEDAER